jgi:competence protein ComEA
MGLQDRDYMRERRNKDVSPTRGVRRGWIIVGAVLALFIVVAITIPRRSNHNALSIPSAHIRPAIVNINRASLDELRALPKISETIAQAIIEGRPYSSVDDLLRVYGIGPKTLERIRPYVKVE